MIRLVMQYFQVQLLNLCKMPQHPQALKLKQMLVFISRKYIAYNLPIVSGEVAGEYCLNHIIHFFWLNDVSASSIPLLLDRFTLLLLLLLLVFDRFPNNELISSPSSIFLLVLLLLLRGITLAFSLFAYVDRGENKFPPIEFLISLIVINGHTDEPRIVLERLTNFND